MIMGTVNSKEPLFPNGRWLVCWPEDYDVRYKINPWMDLTKVPEKVLASSQWTYLHHHLLRLGAWLEYVQHENGVPDMVFTANAGLVRGKNVVLSRFRYQERQAEEGYFRKWFESNGYKVHEVSSGCFEGEGDALFAGEYLFGGHGFRTDRDTLEQAAALLNVKSLVPMELKDPRFYHLDTCFCPLNPNLALIFADAFSLEDVKRVEKSIELLRVEESDAVRFVCNAVVLGQDIVLPSGCEGTYRTLSQRGFRCHPVELSEFIKAGGAAKCLSLKLDQLF